MQILRELFGAVGDAADILGVDPAFKSSVLEARSKLAPTQIGRKGNLQEWLDDWDETEKSHRHNSGLWGLYPGHQISPRLAPELAEASRVVLEQRGLTGNGWSSAWKAACWARLENGLKALENIRYAVGNYTTASLFSICSHAMQVDGTMGMTAAIGEMLLQSDGGELRLLPALPGSWSTGEVRGLRARGGFEVDFSWDSRGPRKAAIRSQAGKICRIRTAVRFTVTHGGKPVAVTRPEELVTEFPTASGEKYSLVRVD